MRGLADVFEGVVWSYQLIDCQRTHIVNAYEDKDTLVDRTVSSWSYVSVALCASCVGKKVILSVVDGQGKEEKIEMKEHRYITSTITITFSCAITSQRPN